MKKHIALRINNQDYELLVADNETLAQVLRGPQVNLTGTQQGCETGDCGACTVLMDGKPIPTVNHSVTDTTQIIGLADSGRVQPAQHPAGGLAMVNNGHGLLQAFAILCGEPESSLSTNPVNDARS